MYLILLGPGPRRDEEKETNENFPVIDASLILFFSV